MRYSTRQVAAASKGTENPVSHQTVYVYFTGGHVSPTSRESIEAAIRRLDAEQAELIEDLANLRRLRAERARQRAAAMLAGLGQTVLAQLQEEATA